MGVHAKSFSDIQVIIGASMAEDVVEKDAHSITVKCSCGQQFAIHHGTDGEVCFVTEICQHCGRNLPAYITERTQMPREYFSQTDDGKVLAPADDPVLSIYHADPAAAEPAKKERKFNFVTADDLLAMDVEPVQVFIPNYLTEGTFVMGCYSGGGKTWLALQLANSIANGYDFLGEKPIKTGKVLFLELELGKAILKERIAKTSVHGRNIAFLYADSNKDDLPGRKDNLTEYLEDANERLGGDIALVIIDVWRNLKRPVPRGEDPDTVIYDQIGELNAFCYKHHAAVMILHHTRKATKETGLQETRSDSLSGSNALAGSMKGGIWLLGGKEGEQRTLYVQLKAAAGSGEHDVIYDKAECRWSIDGNVLERKRQEYLDDPVRRAIIALIGTDSQIKLTSQEISSKIAEMNGGKYTTMTAPDVGRRINAIRYDMEHYDWLAIGQRTGKTDKCYPITRIKKIMYGDSGTQETIEI